MTRTRIVPTTTSVCTRARRLRPSTRSAARRAQFLIAISRCVITSQWLCVRAQEVRNRPDAPLMATLPIQAQVVLTTMFVPTLALSMR